jgi:hypothetical protein
MGPFIDSQIKGGAEFKKVTIPLETLKWLHTIHFSFPNKGLDYYGLGSDTNEKLAYVKAVVEFYERKSFYDEGIKCGFTSTNGIAGHRFYNLAQKAAIAELYERDAFLCHWYSQTPFFKVENTNTDVQNVITELSGLKIKTLFRSTYLGFQKIILCFLINEQTGGFALGLSNDKQNTAKAFSEAVINYFLGHQGKTPEELLAELRKEGLISLQNHRTYWMHENPIPEWVLKISTKEHSLGQNTAAPKTINTFQYKTGPIRISGVQLSEIFTLKLGFPTKEDMELLRRRLGYDISIPNNSLTAPHPIP